MAARIKPNPHIVNDRQQAEGALAEIASLDRKLESIEHSMQEAIDAAKMQASQSSAPLQARRRELADAVAVFARLNRADLFTKAKSLDLAFGTIGFRASTRIVQMRGITSGMTLEKLHQYNFTDGIRIKEEVDKERAADWPDERLELVGLKRQTSDTFFIEIRRDAVPERTGGNSWCSPYSGSRRLKHLRWNMPGGCCGSNVLLARRSWTI